jgi:pescadillo protein
MLPTSPYKPGISPPPHLSPFVDYTQEGYIPDRQREIAQMKGDELEEVDVLSSEDERQIKQNVEQANQSDSDMEDSSSDDDSDLSV